MTTELLVSLASGYLLGSIPFGLILVRLAGLGDLRKIGSGNIGATNALRAGGLKLFLPVTILDMSKAFIAAWFFGPWGGFMAVVGHCYPIWLKFKGGKGFASLAGFALCVLPETFLIGLPIFWLVALGTGYSSLAAFVAMIVAPTTVFLAEGRIDWAIIALVALVFWRERENIKRLVSGTESKMQWRKSR
jgi:glycerol-3-phosphate acyltransferase PlsY